MARYVRHPGLIKAIAFVVIYWAALVAAALLGHDLPVARGTLLAGLLLAGIPILGLAGLQIWRSGSLRAGELANRDDLTGLGNRRAFMTLSRSLLRNSKPGGISLVLIDVDGLKSLNDHCGHQAGDELLVQVGRHLSSVSRTVFRVGGDEFAILVSRSEGQSLTGLLDSLRPTQHQFRACNHEHPLQFSYGFAAYRPKESFEELYRRADSRLREFKEKLYSSGALLDRRAIASQGESIDNDGLPEPEVAAEVVSIFARRGRKDAHSRYRAGS